MTDRVVHSSPKPTIKPPQTVPTTTAAAKPYNQPPPYHRRQPHNHRQRRHSRRPTCSCCCILWYSILLLLFLSLLAAISGAAFYLLYHPQKPTFSISSLKLSSFNLTSDEITLLTSSFNLTLISKNPNPRITFHFHNLTASLHSKSQSLTISNGTSYPSFITVPNSKNTMKFRISTIRQELDEGSARNLERKNGLGLELRLDSKLGAKIGKFETGKVGIRATCHGINVGVRKSKAPSVNLESPGAECEVDFRFKIWQWQFTV